MAIPVKILHVVGDSKFGGGSVIIARLAQMARENGWHVAVLTTDALLQQELRKSGIEVVPLAVIWRDIRPLRDLRGLWTLYRFLKQHHYTIVHTHTSKAGFVGRMAARLAGVPIVMHTAHGFAFHERSGWLSIRCYSLLERIAAYCCDRIVTVSNFHRAWGLRLGIGDEQKIVAIANGIAEDRVKPSLNRKLVRESLGVKESDVVILSTGRLAALKGLEELLKASSLLRNSTSVPFKIWLAGNGPLGETLEKMTVELGIADRVSFLGFRNNIGNLLSASDMVCLPTFREGLSIALLEAMAAGKPIITTRIGSNIEAVQNGEAALLVSPGDVEALASAICRLAEQPELAEKMAHRARQVYLSNYTDQQMLAGYRRQYLIELSGHEQAKAEFQAGKRFLDIFVSAIALLLLSPFMLLIAASIRLTSKGPALFKQRRLGRHGAVFTLYKFRTMFSNAPNLRNEDGSAFIGKNDSRITRVGRCLRKASLDELPQFINVLRGEMSLVGPRPEQEDQIRFYTSEEKHRLDVKPGITGLAQISGRNAISWVQRKQLDLEYVRRQSFWLDLAILLKTPPCVLFQHGVFGDPLAESPKAEDRRVP